VRYQDREWRLLTARLSGVAARRASQRLRERCSQAEAVDELRAVTDDPAVLADEVAEYVTFDSPGWWWKGEAVQLLLDAGADPDLVGDYVEAWAARRAHSFNLGRFAEQLGQTF
jgi:hypothetical protein